jgi:hypothetical protein
VTEDQQPIDPTYLPFTPDQLRPHFLRDADKHIAQFRRSAQAYRDFLKNNPERAGIPLALARGACQIEKDERFWTITALKHLFDAPNARQAMAEVFSRTFSPPPSLPGLPDWAACLEGELALFFEAPVSSPAAYVSWLRENLASRQMIPYVRHAAQRASAHVLEGRTNVDAVIINADNGFTLMVEAKLLSDVSTSVAFDHARNQLARNLDVLLEPPANGLISLSRRRPERSVIAVLTPSWFKEHPRTRLYGYLMEDYRTRPERIGEDLPHRTGGDWPALAQRLGWMTFEDIEDIVPGACPWLGDGGSRLGP